MLMSVPFLSIARGTVRSHIRCPIIWQLFDVHCRYFASVLQPDILKIHVYQRKRKLCLDALGSTADSYLKKMRMYALSDKPVQLNELYTYYFSADKESLPYLLMLSEVTLNKLQKDGLAETYQYSSNIMHVLTHFNATKEARDFMQKRLEDEKFCRTGSAFFTLYIYMDLLFKNEMYEEVIEEHDKVLGYPNLRNAELSSMYIYSCYLLNTPESLSKAVGFIKECKNMLYVRSHIPRLSVMVSHMALKQDRPDICVELLAEIDDKVGSQIRAAALARLGDFHAAKVLLGDQSTLKYTDILNDLLLYVQKWGNGNPVIEKLRHLLLSVQEHRHKDMEEAKIILSGAQLSITSGTLAPSTLDMLFRASIRNHSMKFS